MYGVWVGGHFPTALGAWLHLLKDIQVAKHKPKSSSPSGGVRKSENEKLANLESLRGSKHRGRSTSWSDDINCCPNTSLTPLFRVGFSLSLSADAEAEPTWEMKMVRQERLRHQRTDSAAPCTSSGSTWTVRWECVCWGRGRVGVSLHGLDSHLHHWKAKSPRMTASLPCILVVSTVMRNLPRYATVRMKWDTP